jgi:hypothetical protein
MLARLDAIAVIDSVVGAAPVRGGVSVGTYLGLAAVNSLWGSKSRSPRLNSGFTPLVRTR